MTKAPPQADFVRQFVGCEPRLYAYIRSLVPHRADAENMRCYPIENGQNARGMHSGGGVQAAFVDGSVHFIADEIDTYSLWTYGQTPVPSVWDSLNLSADGTVLHSSDF